MILAQMEPMGGMRGMMWGMSIYWVLGLVVLVLLIVLLVKMIRK